jgi:hypothetical protein
MNLKRGHDLYFTTSGPKEAKLPAAPENIVDGRSYRPNGFDHT